MITRDNYEMYFVDYLEGNLPEDQIDQFLDFLNQNPDLKEELHLFEDVVLPEEKVIFAEKQTLRKSASDENHRFENKVIAHLEGDLSEDERKSFEAYLATQPALKKEYDLFAKTKLSPDLSVHFQAKNKLYRKPAKTIILNWVARAAAVVVLTWGISSLFKAPEKTETAQNQTASAPGTNLAQTETAPKINKSAHAVVLEKEKTAPVKPEHRKEQPALQEEKTEDLPVLPERTDIVKEQLAALQPIDARIETEPDLQLAVRPITTIAPINEPKRVLSAEEFLAIRAKKLGKEGIFSVQRLARLGLNVASEISGERIGYKEKDGKITSVEFESKLMAFSIPLEKK